MARTPRPARVGSRPPRRAGLASRVEGAVESLLAATATDECADVTRPRVDRYERTLRLLLHTSAGVLRLARDRRCLPQHGAIRCFLRREIESGVHDDVAF